MHISEEDGQKKGKMCMGEERIKTGKVGTGKKIREGGGTSFDKIRIKNEKDFIERIFKALKGAMRLEECPKFAKRVR